MRHCVLCVGSGGGRIFNHPLLYAAILYWLYAKCVVMIMVSQLTDYLPNDNFVYNEYPRKL